MTFRQTDSFMKIKHNTKCFLSRMGIFPYLDITRFTPACLCWLWSGSSGCAPPPLKRMVICAYLRRFRLQSFVETGTYCGDTLAMVAQDAKIQCTSIELSPLYAQSARTRFKKYSNVKILEGDSGILITEVVKELNQPALFWLDGHYSAGDTAKGQVNTPVSQELAAILDSPIKDHVVLIDDVRHFDGSQDYPWLDEVLSNIRLKNRFHIEVSLDILRMTPRQAKNSPKK